MLKDYQEFTNTTAIYRQGIGGYNYEDCKSLLLVCYPAMELVDEAGEVLGKVKKALRGDYGFDELREKVAPEIGDVFYPLACLCEELGLDMEEIVKANQKKLQDRLERNVIKGEGDSR